MSSTVELPKRNIFTIKQFCERNPAFTVGGIRHLIFFAQQNGFGPCFKRIGRRVYVDESLFFERVDASN